jgi:excisionase family DNA binding protein
MKHEPDVSLRTAAEMLGLTYRTVYGMVKRGVVASLRHGKVIRLRMVDLRAYRDSCLVVGGWTPWPSKRVYKRKSPPG